jgi:hypothetical protein
MRSQLYVPETTMQYLKGEIQSFVRIYTHKLSPVFSDIESEAEDIANDFYETFMRQPADDDSIDPSSIAEQATDLGIQHFSFLTIGKYNLTATWHATLYQLWEQQVRLFLFREISHRKNLNFKSFCTTINEIKETFACHNVNVHKFVSWSKIDELRLLCNVLKHGDGSAASQLRKVNPGVFRREPAFFNENEHIDFMEIEKTTLLKETLVIDQTTLENYRDALLSFWDEIPERNYSDEL